MVLCRHLFFGVSDSHIAVGVRRLHDVNKSGWWTLIAFIPIIGGIMLLVWYCTDTKPNVNQWGAPARRFAFNASVDAGS